MKQKKKQKKNKNKNSVFGVAMYKKGQNKNSTKPPAAIREIS